MSKPTWRGLQLLLVTLLLACSDEPTAPPAALNTPQHSWDDDDWGWWRGSRDDDDDDAEEFEADLRWIAKYKVPPTPSPIEHALIGPEGGSLRVADFEIIVPPGAVERRVNFSILLPRDPEQAQRAVASFGPHMHFRKPVTIRLPAANTQTTGMPYAMWWAGHFWIPLPTTMTQDGRIETQVWHFSLYGTSARGWTMAGG